MTVRTTTLGALTAADLGKRVRAGVGGAIDGRLGRIIHGGDAQGNSSTLISVGRFSTTAPSTTPVTVYDEEEA